MSLMRQLSSVPALGASGLECAQRCFRPAAGRVLGFLSAGSRKYLRSCRSGTESEQQKRAGPDGTSNISSAITVKATYIGICPPSTPGLVPCWVANSCSKKPLLRSIVRRFRHPIRKAWVTLKYRRPNHVRGGFRARIRGSPHGPNC
jgi:hypothetical protein